MPNPFLLTGGSFLVLYLCTGIVVLLALWTWLRHREAAAAGAQPNLTDPYLIAHLRAGADEALRVATVALLDRGLLEASGAILRTRDEEAVDLARRPVEKAVLKRYRTPAEAREIFRDAPALSACEDYARTLRGHGLLSGTETYASRLPLVLFALGLLVAITWTKVGIALSQGRHNVGFLIALTIGFCIVLLWMLRRRRTGAGDAMLMDLRSLFSRLRGRAVKLKRGGESNEAALLAAVFGLAALPSASFPFMNRLYPKSNGSNNSCGSSCSGSGGSSCGGGSGCGGGGCGGCGG